MINYRMATAEDAPLLARVRMDFLREANGSLSLAEADDLLAANTAYLSRALADGSFLSWMALEDGNIAGTSGVSFYTLPPNRSCPDGKTAYISNMFTYPAYRGGGIATRLFAMTVDAAAQKGHRNICLSATKMGRPLYEKYGFKDAHDFMAYRAE